MSIVEGKVALVTGGASGIGYAYVTGLLRGGAKGVTIADVDQSRGQKAVQALSKIFGIGRVIFIKTDVTSEFELEEAFKKTVNNFQQLDIVVNNAGIVNEIHWEKTISINLNGVIRGTMLAIEAYLPKYKTGEYGYVVNTASIAGLDPIHSLPVYTATKHGIIGIGRAFGGKSQLKHYKVKVITLCPGVVQTALFSAISSGHVMGSQKSLYSEDFDKLPKQPPEVMENVLVEVLEKGDSGSIWIIEGGELYEVEIPERKTLRRK